MFLDDIIQFSQIHHILNIKFKSTKGNTVKSIPSHSGPQFSSSPFFQRIRENSFLSLFFPQKSVSQAQIQNGFFLFINRQPRQNFEIVMFLNQVFFSIFYIMENFECIIKVREYCNGPLCIHCPNFSNYHTQPILIYSYSLPFLSRLFRTQFQTSYVKKCFKKSNLSTFYIHFLK